MVAAAPAPCDMSTQDIDYVEYACSSLTGGRISTTCVEEWYKLQMHFYVSNDNHST